MAAGADYINSFYSKRARRFTPEGGDPCDYGTEQQDLKSLILQSRELFNGAPVCIVKGWVWVDLPECPEFAPGLDMEQLGYKPCFLVAHQLVYDETLQHPNPGMIRSSLLREFIAPCFFRTANSSYILVGSGTRVCVADLSVYHGGIWPTGGL